MRIPDAYFSAGLGQRLPKAPRVLGPDTSAADMVAEAGRGLAQTLLNTATNEMEHQGNLRLQEARERQAEAERLERIKKDGEARTALFSHENVLAQVVDTIAQDRNLSPQEKRDQLRDQADKVRSSFLGSVPEEYQHAFGPSFDEHRYRAEGSLEKYLQKDLQDEVRAAGMTAREQLLNSAKPLAEKLALIKDPDAWDWEGEGYSDEERVRIVTAMAEQATEGEIERRLGTQDPRKVLQELRAQKGDVYAHFTDLSPKTRQAYIRTAKSMIEAQEREAERRRREAEAARKEAAKEAYEIYKEAREGLFPIDPKQEARLWRAMSGSQYEDLAKQVRISTGALGFVAGKVKEDPLKFGAAQMGVQIPGLSVDDPGAWPAQLAARGKVAGAIKQAHGLPYLPVLTNDEAKGLTGLLRGQTPQAQVQTFAALGGTVGKESALHIARQFAADDPLMGLVSALAVTGRDKGAYHVANGRRLKDEKGYALPKPTADSLGREFDQQMGEALSGMPQNRATLLEAARSAYISRAAEAGLSPDEFDKNIFRQALQLLTPGTAKVLGRRVLLPEGVNEGQFLTNWRRIDAARLQAAGGVYGFRSLDAAVEAIQDDAEPWEAGGGRYRFAVDGKFLLTADGTRPLELDLSDMARQRIRIER